MTGKLNLLHPTRCIVRTLVDACLDRGTQDFRDLLILVPTARLGTFFLASLTKSVGACHPPQVKTLEQWIHHSSTNETVAISLQQATLLIGHILIEHPFNFLQFGHEREIALFFWEIEEQGIAHQAFDKLKICLEEDVYKNEDSLGSLYKRIEEIETVYGLLKQQLTKLGLTFKSDLQGQKVNAIIRRMAQDQDPLGKGIHNIWLAGFTSVVPTIKPLFEAFANHQQCQIWLASLPQQPERSPLEELIDTCLVPGQEVIRDASPAQQRSDTIRVMSVDSPLSEAFFALQLMRQWTKSGLPASQLAVIVTNEGDYGEVLRLAQEEATEEFNIALPLPLSQTPLGGFIEAIAQWKQAPLNDDNLAQLLTHPLSLSWLKNQQAFEDDLTSTIFKCLHEPQHSMNLRESLLDSHHKPQLDVFFNKANEFLDGLTGAHSIHAWWLHLSSFIQSLDLTKGAPNHDGFDGVQDAFDSFHQEMALMAHLEAKISFKLFWSLVGPRLLSSDVRSIGEPLKGIQVISLAESRNIPFSSAIILGCNEGTFPKALPRDDLIDDYLKRAIGLPGWAKLEAMEDTTFQLLRERVPHLTLLRCHEKTNELQVRSRFVEHLLSQGEAVVEVQDFDVTAMIQKAAPAIPEEPDELGEGLWDQDPAVLVNPISATSLGRFVGCPYRFYLHKMKVNPLDIIDPSSVKSEGSWLHKTIESFFWEGPFHPWNEEHSFIDLGMERFMRLTQKLGPTGVEQSPAYLQLKVKSWPRFLSFLQSIYGPHINQGISRSLKEVSIKDSFGHAPFSIRGQERRVTGIIDSIDYIDGISLIIDYKRRNPPALARVKSGLEPQLLLYAHVVSGGDPEKLDQTVVGYWNIFDGEWQPCAVGAGAREQALAKGLIKKQTPDLIEALDQCRNLATWREEQVIQRERFYADPTDCGYCEFSGVCRKHESHTGDRLKDQRDLLEQKGGRA